MTYTFKLSRRLAIALLVPALAALALTVGCTPSELTSANDESTTLENRRGRTGRTSPKLTVAPNPTSVAPGESARFTAVAIMSDGSRTQPPVTWRATGGIVDTTGLYTAGSTAGTYRVVASWSGDSAAASVTVSSTPAPAPGDLCVRQLSVSSISALSSAVNGAQAGDCITLAAGTYSSGTLTWGRSGTAEKPIVIQGQATIKLASNAAIYVDGSHLKIKGLRVTGGFWGFHLRGATGVRLDSVQVDNTQQWAVGFRMGSHHDTLSNSRIFDTGRTQPVYGEAVYIGGYVNNTCCTADEAADDNVITGNTFGPNVTAETVDIARGADRLVVTGNTLDGRGTRYLSGRTNGLIGMRGNGHRVAGNVIRYGAPDLIDVYEGTGAVIERNTMALFNQWSYSTPYAVRRTGGSVVVRCDNVVTDLPSGGSAYNVPCQPDGSAPTLARIVVSPDPASVAAGATTRFAAVGVLSDGSEVRTPVSWRATGGTIDSTGLYTAGRTAGDFRVSAKSVSADIADTAAVTVEGGQAPSVTSVTISPASFSLPTGGSQRLTATARLSDGSSSTENIAFSATGGTVTSSGLYTAGPTAGSFRVLASRDGKADTATVTIEASQSPPPPSSSCGRTVNVSTASQLTSALSNAQPGDCIVMAAGTYTLSGSITQTRGGTAGNPVVLRGQGSATVVNAQGSHAWYPKAPYLEYRNFRFTNSFWGFYCGGGPSGTGPGCPHAVFDSMEVDNTRQSAIALQHGSVGAVVARSYIHHTGLSAPQWGEAVYVGGYGAPTTDVKVIGNRFERVTAEAVDISEGSDRTTVTGNVIDGSGAVFINGVVVSLIGVRAGGHTINDNTLSSGNPHGIALWSGSATLRRNRIALRNAWSYPGIGINRYGGTHVVGCDNQVTELSGGGSAYNVSCSP